MSIPNAVIDRIAEFEGVELHQGTLRAVGMPQAWGEKFQERTQRFGEPTNACVLCGRKAGSGDRTALVLVSIFGEILPIGLATVDEVGEYISSCLTQGMFPIGMECRKTLERKGYVQLPSGKVV
jgi:hypothetical protein